MSTACHCGNEKEFSNCCEPYLNGETRVPSAEALMRSRYSAFCVRDVMYLKLSTHPIKRKDFDLEGNRKWAEAVRFFQLEILESRESKDTGFVRFQAHFEEKGTRHVHHEASTFQRLAGNWYFVDGKILEPQGTFR